MSMAAAKIQLHPRVPPDFLLPSRARGRRARLPEPAEGEYELTCDWCGHRNGSGAVEKCVYLPLIECLRKHRHVQRRVVNSPPDGKLGAVVTKRKHIGRELRSDHCAPGEAIIICPYAGLHHV